MTLTPARKFWLLLVPALLLAGAWWRGGDRSQPAASATTTALPDLMTAPVLSPPREDRPSSWTAIGPGLPLDRRGAFEGVADLHQYARALDLAGARGDAEAAWLASRIHDYCATYAMNPAGYTADSQTIGDLHLPAAASMLAARERIGRRCAGFAPGDGVGQDAILAQRRQAARGGSVAAEAALLVLGEPLQDSDEYRRNLVERVLASRDPEAYLALAPAMGASALGVPAYDGLVSGSLYAELAWQLAACRLGLACGADSVLMTSYCANGGICSQNAAQDFTSFVYDAAIPRQSAEKVEEMVDRLLAGGRS